MNERSIHLGILDDRQEDRERLHTILTEYGAVNGIRVHVSSFAAGEELLKNYEPYLYTAVFLDIYLEQGTGIEVAREIRKRDPDTLLIFMTISEDHRAEGFRVHAFDYLEKPLLPEEVYRVMDDILRCSTAVIPCLTFSSSRTEYRIPYSEIVAVCTAGHYLDITDRFGETYHTRMTFSGVSELLLEDRRFLLIIRGVVVNMDYVEAFGDGTCHLTGDLHIPCNRRKEKQLERIWQNYMFAKMRREAMEKGGNA